MKRLMGLLVCIYAGANLGLMAQQMNYPPVNAGDYELVWSDEFNYTGAPDPAKWTFEQGFVRNNELQWYQPQNAVVGDGVLKITAKKEKVKNPNYQKGASSWTKSRKNAECTSSSLTTKGKFDFRYGHLEVRAKVPVQPGAWAAAWTLGTTMPWASCGEIDVMECYYSGGKPSLVANVIHGDDQEWHGVSDGIVVPISELELRDPDWVNKFHIWTMDWDENFIDIKVDGETIKRVDIRNLKNGKIGNYSNPFHLNQYLLLNLAVSGSSSNKPKWNKKKPMEYEVDYVRLYQKKNS